MATGPWGVYVSDPGARNGQSLRSDAPVGAVSFPATATTFTAFYQLDPNTMERLDFEEETPIEVWGRVILGPGLVSPRVSLALSPPSGVERFTQEHGSTGKYLKMPSTYVWRTTKLGTLPLPSKRYGIWTLTVRLFVGPGSAGSAIIGFDDFMLVPATGRMVSPTGKANDSSYPKFVRSTAQWRRTITHDQQGYTTTYGNPPQTFDENGLGGERFYLPPGPCDLLVALSGVVPDDPVTSAATEALTHPATVHIAVRPVHSLLSP